MLPTIIVLLVIVLTLLFHISKELRHMNTVVDTLASEIAQLQSDVAAESTVIASANTLIAGFAQKLADAVAAAQAAGATPDQLTALNALHTQITTDSAGLATAVASGT